MNRTYNVAQEPEDIPALFVEAWMQRDAGFLSSLFSEDAEFVNVVGLWWHNKEDIRKAHAFGFEKIFGDSNLRLMETTVKKLDDHIALVHARMRLRNQTPSNENENPSIRQNIFSFVVRKLNDTWICESAHNTDIVPGADTNLVDEDGSFRSVKYRK
jgi:uncharacterized protein (TIGR02246 family)